MSDVDYANAVDWAESQETVSDAGALAIAPAQAISLVQPGALHGLLSAEIAQQVATAKQYPRDLARFETEVKSLVARTEESAIGALYSRKIGNEIKVGPSIRFAEILHSTWTNLRVATRTIGIGDEFVTAQAVAQDLERNTTVVEEINRSIMYSESGQRKGQRYDLPTIVTTTLAAMSIARRNAILHVIPKPFWEPAFLAAISLVKGDAHSLVKRRDAALAYLAELGVQDGEVFKLFGLRNAADFKMDHLVRLRAVCQTIKDGDATVEAVFRDVRRAARPKTDVGDKLRNGNGHGTAQAPATDHAGETIGEFTAAVLKAATPAEVNAVYAEYEGGLGTLPEDKQAIAIKIRDDRLAMLNAPSEAKTLNDSGKKPAARRKPAPEPEADDAVSEL